MERKNNQQGQLLVITRLINAPIELVWNAWTDPQQIKKWWGPRGFTNPLCEWEASPGNRISIHMKGPDETIYPMNGEFLEIQKPERLVFLSRALDSNSKPLFEVRNTITLVQVKDQTRLTIEALVSNSTPEAAPYLSGMDAGWSQSLDKLEELICKNPPFIIERSFDAPAEKIWKAITVKDEMKKWYFDLAEFKPEVGFKFQFLAGADPTNQFLHLCEITEVLPGKRLTYSWRYDGYSGNSWVSFELFDLGHKTLLKLTHRGLETIAPGHPDFKKENFVIGWTSFMDKGLKDYLERK